MASWSRGVEASTVRNCFGLGQRSTSAASLVKARRMRGVSSSRSSAWSSSIASHQACAVPAMVSADGVRSSESRCSFCRPVAISVRSQGVMGFQGL